MNREVLTIKLLAPGPEIGVSEHRLLSLEP